MIQHLKSEIANQRPDAHVHALGLAEEPGEQLFMPLQDEEKKPDQEKKPEQPKPDDTKQPKPVGDRPTCASPAESPTPSPRPTAAKSAPKKQGKGRPHEANKKFQKLCQEYKKVARLVAQALRHVRIGIVGV